MAVGVASVMDKSANKSADVKSPVLSVGIGFDIVKGFALSAGHSIYSYSQDGSKYTTDNSWTFGVTLNSDLWRVLFNSK